MTYLVGYRRFLLLDALENDQSWGMLVRTFYPDAPFVGSALFGMELNTCPTPNTMLFCGTGTGLFTGPDSAGLEAVFFYWVSSLAAAGVYFQSFHRAGL